MLIDLCELSPSYVRSIAPYQPGKPISELAREMGLDAARVLVRRELEDRKSTRLNSSHLVISYAVFCLKKKNQRVALVGGVEINLARDGRDAEAIAVMGDAGDYAGEEAAVIWDGGCVIGGWGRVVLIP